MVLVTGDVAIIASFIILGGNFWDKLKSPFIYNEKTQFSEKNKK